jgi:hypothetical protein
MLPLEAHPNRATLALVTSIPRLLRQEVVEAMNIAIQVELERREVAGESLVPGRSIHRVEGVNAEQVQRLYQPAGRVEMTALPASVTGLIDAALRSRSDDLRTLLPAAVGCSNWIYVSYGPGQWIAPHIDLPENEEEPWFPKLCGISVLLKGAEGGEFFVDTGLNAGDWVAVDHGLRLAPGLGPPQPDGLEALANRWVVDAAPGDAILYGSEVRHGTRPVTAGRVHKLLSFIVGRDPSSPRGARPSHPLAEPR